MDGSLKIDALDRKIIAELQKDGALSHPQLAEKVGSTAPSCWRRVRQLEDAGILRGVVRLADRKALGQLVNVICQVRMSSYATKAVDDFEELMRTEPRVLECLSMSGEWDYLLRIVAEDVEAYESFLMHTLLKHPAVGGASSQFAMRTVKYETALPIKST